MGKQEVENENGKFILERMSHISAINYVGRGSDRVETEDYDLLFVEGVLSRENRTGIFKNRNLEFVLSGKTTVGLKDSKFYHFLNGVDFGKVKVFCVDDFDVVSGTETRELRTWLDLPMGIGLTATGAYFHRRLNKKPENLPPSRREFIKKLCGGAIVLGTVLVAQSTIVPGALYEILGDYPDAIQEYHNLKQRALNSQTINQRNVIIAAKVNALAKEFKERTGKKPLAVMKYGLMHGDIMNYLEDPRLVEREIPKIENSTGISLRNYVMSINPYVGRTISVAGQTEQERILLEEAQKELKYSMRFVPVKIFE
jgi:hypothetical protein